MSQTRKSKIVATKRRKLGDARHLVIALDWRGQAPPDDGEHRLDRLRYEARVAAVHAGEEHEGWFDVHAAREWAEGLVLAATDDAELMRELDMLGPAPPPELAASARIQRLGQLGRRLLEALEGQPSECQGGCFADLDGVHVARRRGPIVIDPDAPLSAGGTIGDCPECRGTGHNLHGTLAPLRTSPQLRRRRADQGIDADGIRTGDDTWLDDPEVTGYMGPGWGVAPTRVVPRGTQRSVNFAASPIGAERAMSDRCVLPRHVPEEDRVPVRISRGWPLGAWLGMLSRGGTGPRQHDSHVIAWQMTRLPGWRRGELRHAQRDRAERIRAVARRVASSSSEARNG